MENEYDDKFQAPDDYLDYDESIEGISEKDLAELLKEEELKLLAEKDKREKTGQDLQYQKDKLKHKDGLEEDEEGAKKKPCRKLIKKPFFSNRLSLSLDLPPRPVSPPPQYFPPVEEFSSEDRINCQKRKKKYRKRDKGNGKGQGKDEESKEGKDEESKEDTEEEGKDKGSKEDTEEEGKDKGSNEDTEEEEEGKDEESKEDKEEDKDEGENDANRLDSSGIIKGNLHDDDVGTENEEKDIDDHKVKQNDNDWKRRWFKKKSDKNKVRANCRKKESEISITLQPRQIPFAQRDLPPTSPKDIIKPEPEKKIPCRCKKKNCTK